MAKTFKTRIQLKNDVNVTTQGSEAGWGKTDVTGLGGNLVLLKGEFAWDRTNHNFKIGDGTNPFKDLKYMIPTVNGETAIESGNTDYIAVTATKATDGNNDVTLSSSLKTVAVKDATSTNDGLATAYDVQSYVGSFAGGITYKGTLDWENGSDAEGSSVRKTLPTTAKTGDLWIVAKATDDDHKYVTGQDAQVGDFYIAKVDGTTTPPTIAWQHISINFTVEDKAADIAVTKGASPAKTTLAIVDGKSITASVSATAVNVTRTATEGIGGITATDVEAALTEIATEIDNMDVAQTTVSGTNISLVYHETDGVVTIESLSDSYATVTRTAKSGHVGDTGYVAPAYVVTTGDESKLVKASDSANLKLYADDKIAEEIEKLDVTTPVIGTTTSTDSTTGVTTLTLKGIEEEDGKIKQGAGTDTVTLSKAGQSGEIRDLLQTVGTNVYDIIFDCGDASSTEYVNA